MQKFSQKANTKEEAVFILGSGSPRRRELLKEIMDDFKVVDPLDKAGGYAIQTNSELIVENFAGSHSNVIGLPVEMLKEWVKELEITA